MEVAGPLGTPLGLAQRKRASPRGEASSSKQHECGSFRKARFNALTSEIHPEACGFIRRGCVVGLTPGPHRAGVWGPGSKPSPTWGRMHQKDPCHFPPGGGPRTRQQRRPEAGRGRVAVAAGKCSPGRGWHASCLHLATGLLWGLGCPQYGPVPMASLSRLTQGCSDGHCGPTGSIYFSYSSFPGGLLSGDDGRTAPEPDP